MSKRLCIAIDGPVAAGKSTIARLTAKALGYMYIDSGAMYRALAWAAQKAGLEVKDIEKALALVEEVEIQLLPQPQGGNRVLVNGRDVTDKIRGQEIGELASKLSEIQEVRKRMVGLQQQMAHECGVVMEGRDIQTVVLPNAEVKIFLTAPAEERAKRRHLELEQRGCRANYDEVLAEIQARDHRDLTREHSPLQAAPDAIWLDTGGLTIEQVLNKVLGIVYERTAAISP